MSIWKTQKKSTKVSTALEEHSERIFLDCLAANQSPITIFLIGGIRLEGNLMGSDEFTILISTQNKGEQMIYKHSIATICNKIG